MSTVAFLTLGCKLNYAETSTYERGLVEAGFEVVGWKEKADFYVVNTCSVTATSDAKSRNLVRKVHRVNPSALIAVVGCSAQLRRGELEGLDGVWRVFGAAEKALVVPAILEALSCRGVDGPLGTEDFALRAHPTTGRAGGPPAIRPRVVGSSCSERPIGTPDVTLEGRSGRAPGTCATLGIKRGGTADFNKVAAATRPARDFACKVGKGLRPRGSGGVPPIIKVGVERSETVIGAFPEPDVQIQTESVFPAYSTGERTRSFLKVQDGCDNFCAYCTVPYARGHSRSVPVGECVRMAGEIASQGVREVVLTGVNTGSYGGDIGVPFLELLQRLNAVEGIERYRISSIEPNLITPEIIDWIASGTKFQPHFHIPLQSGSDTILAAMGRHYDTAFFRGRIEYIRSVMEAPGKPKVFFGIDLMVGLPGETAALFEQSYSFIESLRPAFIHVFPYSRRPGTPAAAMPGQVSEEEKADRVACIEDLCSRLHDEFVCANKGVREKVLFESSVRGGRMEGYTGNYIRVDRPYDASLVNTLVDIVI